MLYLLPKPRKIQEPLKKLTKRKPIKVYVMIWEARKCTLNSGSRVIRYREVSIPAKYRKKSIDLLSV